MAQSSRTPLQRYGVAVLAIALATALTLLIPLVAERITFTLFLAAVTVSAWYGGRGPGLVATALSIIITTFFILPPTHSIDIGFAALLRLGSFVFLALLVSTLTAARQRAEAAARQSQRTAEEGRAELDMALNAARMGTWQWNFEAGKITCTGILEEMHGLRPGTFDGAYGSYVKLIHPEDRDQVRAAIKAAVESGTEFNTEFRVVWPDGSIHWLEGKGRVFTDAAGRAVRMTGLGLDITPRKEVEQTRAQLAAIVESSDDVIIGKTLDGRITSWNTAAERLYGYTAAEVIGQPISILVPPDRPDELPQLLERLRRGERNAHLETVRRCKDGTLLDVSLTISPIRDQADQIVGTSTIARDITARKRAEEELRAAEERLRIALEAAQIYSWELDQATQKIKYSPNTADVMGFELSEDTAQTKACIHPDDLDAVVAAYEQAMQGAGRFVIEFRNVNPRTGEIVWVRVHGMRIGGQGMEARFVGVTQNITEHKQAEEERERLLRREQAARATAESANRMKDEFLATVSHELRTPLTAILGWARLLCTDGLDGKVAQRAYEVIERNARAQAQLIEDLLDISRIITGRLSLERHTVELAPIIETVLDSVRLAAEAKEIRLQTTLDAGAVAGDAARLQQVIWNLLTNAIKFTPQGGSVAVGLAQADGHAEITISDTGIGIAPDFLPYVFDRFRQADQTASRLFGGLGLGLAIVRHLVELHGGTVAVHSAGEGQGAVFKVRLPLAQVRQTDSGSLDAACAADEQAASSKQQPAILDGLRVLVVEDDDDARDYLALTLSRNGATVESAANVNAAFESFKQTPPDVLVSDIGMPGEDGYELIRQVREFEAQHQRAHTPALALTAYARPEDRARAHAAGYETHLAKPIEPATLINCLANLAARDGQQSKQKAKGQ